MATGNFLTGLLNGFTQTRLAQDGNERRKKKEKLEEQVLKFQLEEMQRKSRELEQQTGAQESLTNRLSGVPFNESQSAALDQDEQGFASEGLGLSDILAQQGALADFANSGDFGKRLMDLQKLQGEQDSRKTFEGLISQSGLGAPGGAPGAPRPSIRLGSDGKSSVTFNPQNVAWKDVGDRLVGVNQDGTPTGQELPKSEAVKMVEMTLDDGSTALVNIGERGSGLGALGSGGVVKKTPSLATIEMNKPIKSSDAPTWVNEDGTNPPPGMTVGDALERGFVRQSVADAGARAVRRGVFDILEKMEKAIDLHPEKSGFGTRLRFGMENIGMSLLDQDDSEVSTYYGLLKGGLAPLVRALGERGSLSDSDVSRLQSLLPKIFPIPDTRKVARAKINQIREILSKVSKEDLISAQRTIQTSGGLQANGELERQPEVIRGPDGKLRFR